MNTQLLESVSSVLRGTRPAVELHRLSQRLLPSLVAPGPHQHSLHPQVLMSGAASGETDMSQKLNKSEIC